MNFLKLWGKYTKLILGIIDIIIIFISYCIAQVFIKVNYINIHTVITQQLINSVLVSIFVYEIFFHLFDLYKNITSYEGAKEYFCYALACMVSCDIVSMLGILLNLNLVTPKQHILAGIFASIILVSYRVIIRFLLTNKITKGPELERKNLLIIGGGEAATDIVKSIKAHQMDHYDIVGIIDDNSKKKNRNISGARVIGNRNDIVKACKERKVDIIFFAISNISAKDRKEILAICQETGIKLRVLPGLQDLINEKNILQSLRDVEIEDILGREPIVLDNQNIATLIKNQVIMITGAGGSIGSELCRQIAKFEPKEMVLLDIYENNLYDIELELKEQYKNIKIDAVIASIRDKNKMDKVFETYKPYLVFHAAAHKHVPLMEGSPLEAIKNNVFGTYHVVNCCDKYHVKRFVLVSTDKAVNPTNIMGATKRMCEMIIQAKDKVSETEFVAVRFGNVLGSNGSVVPLFKKQIAKGGPVTVTHKEITRFFMTIPEAVQLILQATTYAKGGEIFVLDMGEPVKIYDLAVSLIKLSGLEPNVDIPIEITGLRPGEKLYEEILMAEEGLKSTEHDKIFIAKPSKITMEQLEKKLDVLRETIQDENISLKNIKQNMKAAVPTYQEEKRSE
ncbi:MAG: polysaccharide biosynthesis protein [Clostridia bacterium]|nr:polysaccharide biosynthesis protein [Clostridia bacterium]